LFQGSDEIMLNLLRPKAMFAAATGEEY